MQEGSKKAIIAALLANAGIAVAKFVGLLITRSAGLLAETAIRSAVPLALTIYIEPDIRRTVTSG